MILINGEASYNAVLYDLYGNWFVKAPNYINSELNLYGGRLLEPGFNNKMYVLGGGSSTDIRTYNPAGTGAGYWSTVTGGSQYAPGRNNAAVVCLPTDKIKDSATFGCTGI